MRLQDPIQPVPLHTPSQLKRPRQLVQLFHRLVPEVLCVLCTERLLPSRVSTKSHNEGMELAESNVSRTQRRRYRRSFHVDGYLSRRAGEAAWIHSSSGLKSSRTGVSSAPHASSTSCCVGVSTGQQRCNGRTFFFSSHGLSSRMYALSSST